jgi:lipid II:glycine glycyltransferase (peptidoglycan interpeptide bridge formation enzyme)
MILKADILEKDCEEEYKIFLQNCRQSSVQYSLAWRKVVCDLGKDQPYFVVAKEKNRIVGALPLYFYRCPFGNIMTTACWYTITGIICEEKYRSEVYRILLDFALSLAKELDCVAISIGTNPFVNDKDLYIKTLQPEYTMENFIQYIELSEIFNKAGIIDNANYFGRTDLSINLRKARKQPMTVSEEPTKSNVDKWYAIHENRMRELNGNPLPKELISSIKTNLALKNKGKFVFAFHEEKLIFGGIYLFDEKEIDAFMMSADSGYRNLRASYLVTRRMLEWGHNNRMSTFNWMSSPMRNDGVYRFKKKWGSNERVFFYLTKVLGDISTWTKMGYHELMDAYSFHYLLPFNLLKTNKSKFTTKEEVTSFVNRLNRSEEN